MALNNLEIKVAVAALVLLPCTTQAWEYTATVDDFAGDTRHTLTITAGRQFLQLRCAREGAPPYWRVHWAEVITADLDSTTATRGVVDGVEIKRGLWDWRRDDTYQAAYTYRVSRVIAVLLKATELKLRVRGAFGEPYTAIFDVTGLEQGLTKMAGHCEGL